MATIEQASTHLETFISERENLKVLEDCIGSLQQIRGSLDLIQLYGACELAGEILSTASQIDTEHPDQLDDKLSALTKGFFVLSCYFEYTQQHEVGMPVLLIPYINDIRQVNRQPLLPESYFEQGKNDYRCPKGTVPILPNDEELTIMLRRFRHMYQVGLLGVIKEVSIDSSLMLMQRASEKVHRLSKGSDSETLWWLATHALSAFKEGEINPTVTRKRLFALLDKELRILEKEGVAAFAKPLSAQMLNDLAYYIAISNVDKPEFEKIKQLFNLSDIGYTESILQQESISLTGPSANTVQSVADVLRVELNIVKENIERIQSADGVFEEDYADTIDRMQRVKDILNVVGLTSASNVIEKPLALLNTAEESKEGLSDDSNMEVVNALLYVESVINSLAKRNFSGDKLAELNQLTQNEMISSHHLHDTQLVVIDEAENGLTAIKQALTTFSDSSFDKAHLESIPALLNELRGGVTILGLPRAAAIVTSCTTFVIETLMATDETAALEHMLETFADALICLEYYLDCMKVDKNVSPDTLAVAEESLAALGYSVNA
jgi:hypothetical protein